MQNKITKIALLILIIATVIIIYKLQLAKYLNFAAIKSHYLFLTMYVANHYFLAILIFMLVYSLIVATSIPAATILTVLGGLLFGRHIGTALVVISASMGAMVPYLVAKFLIGDYITSKILHKARFMEKNIKQNQFFYILSLRFLPIIPFWFINLAAGSLKVRSGVFFLATFVGIIPASFIYVNIGASLTAVIQTSNSLDIKSFLDIRIFIALFLLAILSFIPTLIKRNKTKV
jgi:uncharacterized membrane protein YdjX (TVP38/TMEM64 family)